MATVKNSSSDGRATEELEADERSLRQQVTDLEELFSYVSDIMDAIPHPVYMVNSAGIIIDCNKSRPGASSAKRSAAIPLG